MVKQYYAKFKFANNDIINNVPIVVDSYSETNVCYNALKSADWSVKFNVPFSTELANKLKTNALDEIEVCIFNGTGALIHGGLLSGGLSFQKTQKNQPISITVTSPFYSCNKKADAPEYMLDTTTGQIYSTLVNKALGDRFTIGCYYFNNNQWKTLDVTSATLNTAVPFFKIDKDENYKSVLVDFLYEYGLAFTAELTISDTGKSTVNCYRYDIFEKPVSTSSITQIFDGNNIRNSVTLEEKLIEHGGVAATWVPQERVNDTKLFLDESEHEIEANKWFPNEATEQENLLDCDSELGTVLYIYSKTASYNYDSASGFGAAKSFNVSLTDSAGTRLTNQLSMKLQANASKKTKVTKIEITGDALIERSANGGTETTTVTSKKDIQDVTLKYVHTKDFAQTFARNLADYYRYSTFTVKLDSSIDYELGSFVKVTEDGIGTIYGRIIKKEIKLTDTISYTIENYADYVPATINRSTRYAGTTSSPKDALVLMKSFTGSYVVESTVTTPVTSFNRIPEVNETCSNFCAGNSAIVNWKVTAVSASGSVSLVALSSTVIEGETGTKTFVTDYARSWDNDTWNSHTVSGYTTTTSDGYVQYDITGMRVGDIITIPVTLTQQGNITGVIYARITGISEKVSGTNYYRLGTVLLYSQKGEKGQKGDTGVKGPKIERETIYCVKATTPSKPTARITSTAAASSATWTKTKYTTYSASLKYWMLVQVVTTTYSSATDTTGTVTTTWETVIEDKEYESVHSITTADIVDASITNAKIANEAIKQANIENGAIVTAKLADDAVTSAKIVDASVTAAKIIDNAITSAKIDDNAVTAAKIDSGVLVNTENLIRYSDLNKLADGTIALVSNSNISATNPVGYYNSNGNAAFSKFNNYNYKYTFSHPTKSENTGIVFYVPGSSLDVGETYTVTFLYKVTNAAMKPGFWPSYKTTSGSNVWNGGVNKKNPTAVNEWCRYTLQWKYEFEDLDYGIFAFGFSGSGAYDCEIAMPQMFRGSPTMGMVDTSLIVDGAIETSKIADAAIVSDLIAANAITEAKINNGAITTTKITDSAITTDKINANAITAAKIGANAVTSEKIIANAITADKVAANAITAGKIVATAINRIDPLLSENSWCQWTTSRDSILTNWSANHTNYEKGVDPVSGVNALVIKKNDNAYTNYFDVEPDEILSLDFDADLSQLTSTDHTLYCGMYPQSAGTTDCVFRWEQLRYENGVWSTNVAANGNLYLWNQKTHVRTHVKTYIVGYNVSLDKIPAPENTTVAVRMKDVAYVNASFPELSGKKTRARLRFLTTSGKTWTSGDKIYLSNIKAESLSGGKIIAGNITAGAITTDKLAANAVTANKIAAGTITADKLASKTLSIGNFNDVDKTLIESAGPSATAAAASASAACTSETNAAGSATTATNCATKASNCACVSSCCSAKSSNCASSASTYASNASTSASNACTSETNAATSATTATNCATKASNCACVSSCCSAKSSNCATKASNCACVSSCCAAKSSNCASCAAASATLAENCACYVKDFDTNWTQRIKDTEIQTGCTLISGGWLNTGLIEAKAISTNLIASCAVVADNLASSAVTTDKLAANAVTAGKIASHTISTAQMAVGNGVNLLSFGMDTFDQWDKIYTDFKASSATATLNSDLAYVYAGGKSIKIASTSTNGYIWVGATNWKVKLEGGKKYCISAYVKRGGTGSTAVQLYAERYDAQATALTVSEGTQRKQTGSSLTLSDDEWHRISHTFDLEAARPWFMPRFDVDTNGQSAYFSAVMLEEIEAGQSAGPFSPCGTTIINGGNITANTIAASTVNGNAIIANTLSADKLNVLAKNRINNFSITGTTEGWTLTSGMVTYDSTNKRLQIVRTAAGSNPSFNSNEFTVNPNEILRLDFYIETKSSPTMTSAQGIYIGLNATDTYTNYNWNGTKWTAGSASTNKYFLSGFKQTGKRKVTTYILGYEADFNDLPAAYNGTENGIAALKLAAGKTTTYLRTGYNNGVAGSTWYLYSPEITEINGGKIIAQNIDVDNLTANSSFIEGIFANDINVGNAIKSSNWTSKETGFKISSDGKIEANNLEVNNGSLGGIVIDDEGIQSSDYSDSSGFRIDKNGNADFASGRFRGSIGKVVNISNADRGEDGNSIPLQLGVYQILIYESGYISNFLGNLIVQVCSVYKEGGRDIRTIRYNTIFLDKRVDISGVGDDTTENYSLYIQCSASTHSYVQAVVVPL